MEINILGRVFYLLTNQYQFAKLYTYLHTYWFDNTLSLGALALMILIFVCAFAIIPVNGKWKTIINYILLFADAAALYTILVLSRSSGTRELRAMHISDYLSAENGFHESEILIACLYILMFIPFGILLRRASSSGYKKRLLDLAVVLVFAIFIEGSQYVLARGTTYPGHALSYLCGAIIGEIIMSIGLYLSLRSFSILALIVYYMLIYAYTVITRPTSYGYGVQLTPFWGYYDIYTDHDKQQIFWILMNIAMFMPIGFFLSLAFKKLKFRYVFLIAFVLSYAIEFSQLIFHKGNFELFDDPIHNILGCILGFCIGMILKKLFSKKQEPERT